LGIITTVKALQDQVLESPTRCIQTDYDIKQAIFRIAESLPFPVELYHVKGHQDRGVSKEKVKELPKEARLNIECDERAKMALELGHGEGTQQPTPFLPGSEIAVKMDGEIITGHITRKLREAASTPGLRAFLKNKFELTDEDCDDIQWSSLGYAIRKQTNPDRNRILKLINGWMPVNEFLFVQSQTQTKSCPTCKHPSEDTTHFLGCSHESRSKEWEQCVRNLNCMLQQSETSKDLSQLLFEAIQAGRNGTQVDYSQLSTEIRRVAQAQESIGWQQVLFGRFSQQWGLVYEELWKRKHGDGGSAPLAAEVWIAQVIKIIWKTILSTWKLRNEDKFGSTDEISTRQRLKRERLQAQVRSLYNQRDQIPAHATTIFQVSKAEMLQRPNNELEEWLTYATIFIKKQRRVLKKQEAQGLQDIRGFYEAKEPIGPTPAQVLKAKQRKQSHQQEEPPQRPRKDRDIRSFFTPRPPPAADPSSRRPP
jgi:hypothetical protein